MCIIVHAVSCHVMHVFDGKLAVKCDSELKYPIRRFNDHSLNFNQKYIHTSEIFESNQKKRIFFSLIERYYRFSFYALLAIIISLIYVVCKRYYMHFCIYRHFGS